MQAEEMHRIEDELIDEQTGEIIEGSFDAVNAILVGDANAPTVESLPKILRALRAVERQMDMVKAYREAEQERINALCQQKLERLTLQYVTLKGLSFQMLRASGQKRLDYPGLGVVRFGSTRESVNTEKWDALTPDEKKARKDTMWSCLTVKETIAPNKPEIMKQIKNGVSDVCDLFHINEKQETFIFKAEE